MMSLDNNDFGAPLMPSFFSLFKAEFLKLFSFRLLPVTYIMIPASATLFVFTTYFEESVRSDMKYANTLQWAVLHFHACWGIFLFQIFLASFTAFVILADNQHGMLRMILTQPISRFSYLCSKLAGLHLHITIFCLELVLTCLLTSFVMVGSKGISSNDVSNFLLMVV
jgi:ABC-type transport system involved in multi-copper enzyme maturation permease subunit